ncbi:hypothetical protein MXB_2181 [Myxobolus squamalis]|nr:hypothetical protein MXB_2181 [Myxobolus squamalis]
MNTNLLSNDLKLFRLSKFVAKYPKVLTCKELENVCNHRDNLDSFLQKTINPQKYIAEGTVDPEFFKKLLSRGLYAVRLLSIFVVPFRIWWDGFRRHAGALN